MSNRTESPDRTEVGGVIPHLVCDGASDAIEFYEKAFGAEELMRLPGPDGKLMHAAVRINGSMVMLADEFPQHGGRGPKTLAGTPVTLHLGVEDARSAAQRAVDAGARVVLPVDEQFWGDVYGIVEDPFGHHWALATPRRPAMSIEEMQEAMQTMGA